MPDTARLDHKHGIELRTVARVMVALGAMVLLAAIGAHLALRGATTTARLLAPNTPGEIHVSGVALESAPRSDRAAYAAEKQRLLHAREWIDADAGIARIPIDAAMQELARRDAATRRDTGTPP